MKRPVTALLIAGENQKNQVKDGSKSITIRLGHRDYKIGDTVVLCCHILDWASLAKITSVSHCKLKDVSENDLKDDGMNNLKDAIIILSEYYSNINEESDVTVIRWKLI
jgi:hypothetical protein